MRVVSVDRMDAAEPVGPATTVIIATPEPGHVSLWKMIAATISVMKMRLHVTARPIVEIPVMAGNVGQTFVMGHAANVPTKR